MEKFKKVISFIKKNLTFVSIGLIAIILAWLFVNRYLIKPKAAQPTAHISFSPNNTSVSPGSNQTTDLIITPNVTTNKINSFTLNLTASGNLQIIDIAPPASPIGNTSQYTELIKQVTSTSARLEYMTFIPASQLLSTLLIKITYVGTAVGSGAITVNLATSSVQGNFDDPVTRTDYALTADTGNFTFSNPNQPTPTPTLEPQPTLTTELLPTATPFIPTTTPVPSRFCYIAINMSKSVSLFKLVWKSSADVIITEGATPLNRVSVSGHWSGVYSSSSVSCRTNRVGECVLKTSWIKPSGTVTFTIDKVIYADQACILTGQTSNSITH